MSWVKDTQLKPIEINMKLYYYGHLVLVVLLRTADIQLEPDSFHFPSAINLPNRALSLQEV